MVAVVLGVASLIGCGGGGGGGAAGNSFTVTSFGFLKMKLNIGRVLDFV